MAMQVYYFCLECLVADLIFFEDALEGLLELKILDAWAML
jgi:hypothetical protein